MRDYNGIEGDSIERGGSYNKDATGLEVCNFSDVGGKVFDRKYLAMCSVPDNR